MTETTKKKILIVEDDPGINAFLKTALRTDGYETLSTSSAAFRTWTAAKSLKMFGAGRRCRSS